MHWRRTRQPTLVFLLENAMDRGEEPGGLQSIRSQRVRLLLSHVCLFVTPWTAARQASCSSPSPRVCPSSCSCHPAIASSDALFSFSPQSFPASGTFPMSCLSASDDQNTGASASASARVRYKRAIEHTHTQRGLPGGPVVRIPCSQLQGVWV